MPVTVNNIFMDKAGTGNGEHFFTLFENAAAKIERIVSRSHSSPEGFWYDQAEDEWVIVLRGSAALEFQADEIVAMNEGDYVLIPRGVRHRVAWTGAGTIWLSVHIR
jgi:cupin 2 domain-containing protein